MIIGMDPKTGEMLAMAVKPSFNPNEFIKYAPEEWRNRIVSDPYEPGSTLKVIVASAALEDKVASPSEPMFFGEDKIDIDGEIIHDTVKEKGRLSFRDVIKRSSNVGAVRIGMRLGKERLYSHLKSFGFGERTDIDISGGVKGDSAADKGMVKEVNRLRIIRTGDRRYANPAHNSLFCCCQ